ncbi:MAG TPA: four-helix bundle copper-binding protein [Solirubrobacteraceae bacterium]
MSLSRDMLDASPVASELPVEDVAAAIDACLTSQQSCVSCANSDLAEHDVAEMARCIALCTSCADVCAATMHDLSRRFATNHRVTHHLLRACVLTCTDCADECERHATHHRHCALCLKACRACAQACQTLLEAEAFAQLEKLAGG